MLLKIDSYIAVITKTTQTLAMACRCHKYFCYNVPLQQS